MTPPRRTAHACWFFLALACRQEDSGPRSFREAFEAFEDESGLSFAACGGFDDEDAPLQVECGGGVEGTPDAAFQQASECLLDNWEACQPAKIKLTWGWGMMLYGHYVNQHVRAMYVVPHEEASGAERSCSLVVFERTDPELTLHQECSGLRESGACGTLEPEACSLVESLRFTLPTKD